MCIESSYEAESSIKDTLLTALSTFLTTMMPILMVDYVERSMPSLESKLSVIVV